LCAEHGLTSISLYASVGVGRLYCFVHWGDRECPHQHGDTIEQAIANTIDAANAG
jgi:hypothetical protein